MPTEGYNLAWDYCLPERQSETHRVALEEFRKHSWPRIAEELVRTYEIEPEAEPHWVAPGMARFWECVVPRELPEGLDGGQDVDWQPGDWQLTSSAFSVRNSPTLVRFLRKGLRLRPPRGSLLEAAEGVEIAVPPDVNRQERRFTCKRHGARRVYRFDTWQGYINHCNQYREVPQEEAPAAVMRRLKSAPYACYQHNMTFSDRLRAEMHLRQELSRPGRAVHVSVDEMAMTAAEEKVNVPV